MIERWKIVKNYPKYMVSDQGHVKHVNSEKFRIPQDNGNGYKYIAIRYNGKHVNLYVHILVATAFVPNDDPEHKTQVSHLDESRDNNVWTNLCWCTAKENCNMPLHKERMSKSLKGLHAGEKNPMYGKRGVENPNYGRRCSEETKRKISEGHKGKCVKAVYSPELNMTFNSLKEAAAYVGVVSDAISNCLRGRSKHAGKHPITGVRLTWQYKKEVAA